MRLRIGCYPIAHVHCALLRQQINSFHFELKRHLFRPGGTFSNYINESLCSWRNLPHLIGIRFKPRYMLKISGDKFSLTQIFSAGPAKGQLFSEGNFDVFKSPKKRTKFLKNFCPNLWNGSMGSLLYYLINDH